MKASEILKRTEEAEKAYKKEACKILLRRLDVLKVLNRKALKETKKFYEDKK